jgi:hypothetical protein
VEEVLLQFRARRWEIWAWNYYTALRQLDLEIIAQNWSIFCLYVWRNYREFPLRWLLHVNAGVNSFKRGKADTLIVPTFAIYKYVLRSFLINSPFLSLLFP